MTYSENSNKKKNLSSTPLEGVCKNIIITGGSSGIGESVIDLLLKNKANVVNIDVILSKKLGHRNQNINIKLRFSVNLVEILSFK